MSTERWIADGDLLYYGDGVDEWVKFPGAPAYAARLAERHNAALDVLDAQLADVMRAGDMEHARNVTLVERAEQAEASAAAMREALDEIDHQPVGACEDDFGNIEPCDSCGEMRTIARNALADDAGATLLAELTAARAVIAASRRAGVDGMCSNEEAQQWLATLAAYDTARGATDAC